MPQNSVLHDFYEKIIKQTHMFGKYNPNLANLIVRSVVFSLKYNGDCGCAQTNPLIPYERDRLNTKNLPTSSISKEVKLETEDEIDWHLEVITFGLSMNRDLDSIRHCSHIYLQWLSCLTLPVRNSFPHGYPEYIPLAIGANPQFYARKIILGLCNFFAPRQHEYQNVDIFGSLSPSDSLDQPPKRSSDLSSSFLAEWEDKQPTIACLIMNKIQEIFLDKSAADFLSEETWDTLLQFCIASSHAILAPLIIPGLPPSSASSNLSNYTVRSLNTQNQECLADRAIQMLLSIWLKACASDYPPSEGHWNALAFACKQWRHRPAFVHHWHILLILLTRQLCARYESPETSLNSCRIEVADFDYQIVYWNLILDIRDFQRVKNCWSRILNIFGNLVDLCHSSVILKTPILSQFLKESKLANLEQFIGQTLPLIFHESVFVISALVDQMLDIFPNVSQGVNPLSIIPSELLSEDDKKRYMYFSRQLVTSSRGRTDSINSNLSNSLSIATNNSGTEHENDHFYQKKKYKLSLPTSSRLQAGAHSILPSFVSGAGSSVSSSNVATPTGSAKAITESLASQELADFELTDPKDIDVESRVLLNLMRMAPNQNSVCRANLVEVQKHAKMWLINDTATTAHSCKSPQTQNLLQLIGDWLFEASISGVSQDLDDTVVNERAKLVPANEFQVGRAEAIGALCRLFIYSRGPLNLKDIPLFYMSLYYCFQTTNKSFSEYSLAIALYNCRDLLRINLVGVSVLLPSILGACEYVLTPYYKKMVIPQYLTCNLLRCSILHQLISMVCMPIQFKNVSIKILLPVLTPNHQEPQSYSQVLDKLIQILTNMLSHEDDENNIRMVLSCTLALIVDFANDQVQCPSNKGQLMSFVVMALGLMCHMLETKWLEYPLVMVYILEILSSVAQVNIPGMDLSISRKVVDSICRYITSSLSRDKKDHTRLLHSNIVTAYHALSTWSLYHGCLLLTDYQCLEQVLEVVERGLTGTVLKKCPPSTRTAEVNLNSTAPSHLLMAAQPASHRVKEAAELTLSTIMCLTTEKQCSFFLPNKPTEAQLFSSQKGDPPVESHWLSYCKFYWCSRKNLLLSVMELPYQDPPNGFKMFVTARNVTSRHLWTFKSSPKTEQEPFSDENEKRQSTIIALEQMSNTFAQHQRLPRQCFPEMALCTPPLFTDKNLVRKEDVLNKEDQKMAALKIAIEQECKLEEQLIQKQILLRKNNSGPLMPPAYPPKHTHESKNLGVSNLAIQLGFLPFNRLFENTFDQCNLKDSFQQVKPSSDHLASFLKEILALDKIVAKATHTIYTYFVKKDQRSAEVICGNMNDFDSLPGQFKRLIFAFGVLTDVKCHTGWTGNVETSYKETSADESTSQEFPSLPDGIERIIYWSDALNELALLCPKEALNLRKKASKKPAPCSDLEGGEIALVWLESWDDYKPHLGCDYFDCLLIVYVHPLANGLLRVAISRSPGRQFEAGPLISGLVLSIHTLAQMLRQTAINSARRRRVQSDLYQSVQSRRLAKLKNIVQPSIQEVQPKQQLFFSSKLVQNCTGFFDNVQSPHSLIA